MDPPNEPETTTNINPAEAARLQGYVDQLIDIVQTMDPATFPGSLNPDLVGWGDETEPLTPLPEYSLLPPVTEVRSNRQFGH